MPYHLLFVFLDGVGLGTPDPDVNPLAVDALPALSQLAGGQRWTIDASPIATTAHVFHALDARLGVEGLPQSGTGQATLFTGVNCAALAGRHYGPYPHSKTKPLLATDNLFVQVERLVQRKDASAFANAYPPQFFAAARARSRWTVTTRCCLDAGLPLRDVDALRAGQALAADLTGEGWRRALQLDVTPITEHQAGVRLVRLSEAYVFTLFEYYLTDKAGHSQSFAEANGVLQALDRFLRALVATLDLDRALLIITSDHGNLEDLSTRSHTLSPVPLVAFGSGAEHFAGAKDLTGVAPAIMNALREHAG